MVLTLIDSIGTRVLGAIELTGDFAVLAGRTFAAVFKRPFDGKNLMNQFQAVGVNSIPVVVLTSLAVSMVFAVQLAFGFRQFQAEGLASQVEGLAIVRELGPVITGLMLSGRIGSAMAAELGTMQVTEQIDALYTLAINPVHYLVVPRFLAALIIMPILTAFADVVGILGGFLISVILLGTNPTVYNRRTYDFLSLDDIYIGLLKACIFGMIIAIIGCYQGLNTRGGAEGVGKSTTNAVVVSSLLILVANYFITALLF